MMTWRRSDHVVFRGMTKRLLLVGSAFLLCLSSGCSRPAPVQRTTQAINDAPPLCGTLARSYIAPQPVLQSRQPGPLPQSLGHATPLRSRITREGQHFARYTQQDQQLIGSGRARPGLDERAVYLAHGVPAFYWNTNIGDMQCKAMLYGVTNNRAVDTAVYTCEGIVRKIMPLESPLPCWRLKEVAPRIIEKAAHFDKQDIQTNWEILLGLLKRGHHQDDVYISFGKAYNTGIEAREDGTNVTKKVFLDSAGDAYALHVNFGAKGQVLGWTFPAARTLTPEAEQRRLSAMENRMMTQLRQMDARSIAQHREEMTHLANVQANQQKITDGLTDLQDSIDSLEVEPNYTTYTVGANGSAGSNPNITPPTGHKVYMKKVRFKCNDKVIIDETFHSFEACDQYRRDHELYCSGMKIPVNC